MLTTFHMPSRWPRMSLEPYFRLRTFRYLRYVAMRRRHSLFLRCRAGVLSSLSPRGTMSRRLTRALLPPRVEDGIETPQGRREEVTTACKRGLGILYFLMRGTSIYSTVTVSVLPCIIQVHDGVMLSSPQGKRRIKCVSGYWNS